MWCFPCGPAPRQIDVVVARDWAPRRPGIRVHRTLSLTQRDVRRVDEVPVTSPARTLLDLGADLARDDHEAVVADALRRHLVRPVDLEEQLTRNGRLRGAASLRAILETESGPAFTRSAAERRLLALVRNSSLPSPVVNARVAGYEVDFLWPHERVIVEVDGFQWHADRTAFERDRERDAELQALGYRVVRVTWRQLTQEPAAVVRRLERVLQARSGTYA
jgi:very-short-patch-repair endonuclease